VSDKSLALARLTSSLSLDHARRAREYRYQSAIPFADPHGGRAALWNRESLAVRSQREKARQARERERERKRGKAFARGEDDNR